MSIFADHIILSSKDRQHPTTSSPENCTLILQNPITNFQRLEIVSFIAPSIYYNIGVTYNNIFNINSGVRSLPIGLYTLSSFLNALQTLYNDIPGFTCSFNTILGRIVLSATSVMTVSFFGLPDTALTIGADFTIYTTNNLIMPRPPNLAPEAIFINIDVITHVNTLSILLGGGDLLTDDINGYEGPIASCTFAIPNNANAYEYVNYEQNLMFSQRVYSNNDIVNSLKFTLFRNNGFFLQGLGDWQLILRVVRVPYEDEIYNEVPETFSSPNIIL